MKNWDERDEKGFCSSDADYEDALYISEKLQIPLTQVNYVKEYWNEVFWWAILKFHLEVFFQLRRCFSNFIKDYQEGLTPNPDILCNRQIKFNLFFKHAIETLNCDAIATGHYAKSSFGAFLENFHDDADVKLMKSVDTFKDQTFFLSQVPQRALKRCMFPIGTLNKHQVKDIADEIGLHRISRKKESTGICFIGRRTFQSFINDYIDIRPGEFVDIDSGKVVGSHKGIHNWTLGQRCNLSGSPKPFFVYRKDPQTSTIYVAAGTDHPLLWTDIFYTKDPFWIRKSPLALKNLLTCQFRFQHTKPLTDCTIYTANPSGDKLLIKLEKPLRSITPGQYAVLYKDDECLGSSRIFDSGPSINVRWKRLQQKKDVEIVGGAWDEKLRKHKLSFEIASETNFPFEEIKTRKTKKNVVLSLLGKTKKISTCFRVRCANSWKISLPRTLSSERIRVFCWEMRKLQNSWFSRFVTIVIKWRGFLCSARKNILNLISENINVMQLSPINSSAKTAQPNKQQEIQLTLNMLHATTTSTREFHAAVIKKWECNAQPAYVRIVNKPR